MERRRAPRVPPAPRSPYHGWQRRWLILVGSLLGIAIPALALHYGTGPDRAELVWQEFASPDNSFVIKLPGNPKVTAREVQTAAGIIVENRLAWPDDPNAGRVFAISWADYDKVQFTASPDAILDAACDAVMKQHDFRLNKRGAVSISGHPGRELMGPGPLYGKLMTVRVYLVGERVYELLVAGHQDWEESFADVSAFLDSFKLTPAKK